MTYLGTVKEGLIELKDGPRLPDGTLVKVEPLEPGLDPGDGRGDKAAASGIVGLAGRPDHYLYGAPKSGLHAVELPLAEKRKLLHELGGSWAGDPSIGPIFDEIERQRLESTDRDPGQSHLEPSQSCPPRPEEVRGSSLFYLC